MNSHQPKRSATPKAEAHQSRATPKAAEPVVAGSTKEVSRRPAAEVAASVDLLASSPDASEEPRRYANPLLVAPSAFNGEDHAAAHLLAMAAPRPGFEKAIALLTQGLVEYARAHDKRYESPVGEDGVIGESWTQATEGVLGLLVGETGGRLDCGTLDTILRTTAKTAKADLPI